MPDRPIRYRERAQHLREMAAKIADIAAKKALFHLADEYERTAAQIEKALAARTGLDGSGQAGKNHRA